jgi:multidrug/hemolysin transport system ATP-binding protein
MRKNKKEVEIPKENILEIQDLVKTYGSLTAVNNISLNVRKGSLFAFLGVNGAGKSTTINIICNILSKDSGKIYVDGYDLDKNANQIKEEIGIVFQNSVLDQDLTVKENLEIRASFYSMSNDEKRQNISKIIDLLNLKLILDKPIKNLSGGQKRRVDIARAMVHTPKLLILDEPTTGLDPKTRLIVWSLIDDIRKKTGMTVFLTTHYLEEAEKATFVVIMNKGNIIAQGTPNELKNKYSYDYILAYMKNDEQFEKILMADKIKFNYIKDKKAYKIAIKDTIGAKDLINKYDKYLIDFEVLKGNMDDVFLNVTGNNITLGVESEQNGTND